MISFQTFGGFSIDLFVSSFLGPIFPIGMATITVQVPVKEEIQTLGAYKEFAAGPGTYSQAAEEEGDGVHGKATVRISHSSPLSDATPASRSSRLSSGLLLAWLMGASLHSIRITSQPGIQTRNTRH